MRLSLYLAFLIILSMIAPAFIVSYGAVNSINITDENGTYDVVIIANNGHSSAQSITVENIDKEAPTVNSISIAHKENGGFARFLNKLTFKKFFNEKVEITIDASDKGVSGIDRIEYRLLDENASPIDDNWKIYNESDKPTQDSEFKGFVEARAIDKATNESDILRSDGYVIDRDNPTDVIMNATYNEEAYTPATWVAGDVNVELSSTAFSGIYEYCYRVDGGEWISLDSDTFTATQAGMHKYEFKAISYSNLESAVSEMDIRIDRQIPVIRVDFEGTFGRWSGDSVKFKLSTEEESLSGVSYYYDNGNDWVKITTGEEIEINYNVNATFRFKAVNNAGVESYVSPEYKVHIENKIDIDALKAAVEKFSQLNSSDYSEASYNNLKNVVDKNKSLLDTAQSQEAVDQAVIEILEAIYELQPYFNFIVSAENGGYEVTCNGSVSGNGSYSLLFGTEITLSATANEGYDFIGWYDVTNNLYFSKESTYTFMITSNTNLIAVFAEKQSVTLTFTTYSNWCSQQLQRQLRNGTA